MAATWVESSYVYNLLNYSASRSVDAIAGSAVTRYTSRTEYDSNYNAVASISPLGNRSHSVFDERDLVYQRVAGAESDVQGSYQNDYDANGNVVSSFDALGNETSYSYDGFDRTTQVTDAAGHYRSSAYDANSNVTSSSAYDSFNTLLAYSETSYDQINRGYISKRLANDHNGLPIGDYYLLSPPPGIAAATGTLGTVDASTDAKRHSRLFSARMRSDWGRPGPSWIFLPDLTDAVARPW